MKKELTGYFMCVRNGRILDGYIDTIKNSLSALQKYVNDGRPNGLIEVVNITDDIIAIINEEGKINGLPLNRLWFQDGRLCDCLMGNILCVRGDMNGNFIDIKKEDIETIENTLVPFNKCNHDELLQFYRIYYRKGDRLKLTKDVKDPYSPHYTGEVCTVDYIDDALNIHVKWENERGNISLIIGVDEFIKIP